MQSDREPRRNTTVTPIGRALLLGALAALAVGALLWWDFPPKQFAFALGDVSRVRISAARQITFDSLSRTREAQDKAAAAIADVYDPPDVQIGRQQLARAQSILNYLDSIRHDPYTNFDQKRALVAQIPELTLTPEILAAVFALDDSRWALVSRESLATLEQIMRTEIRPEQLADARRVLPRFVSRELTNDETTLASELATGFVAPNSLPNPARTAQLRDDALKAVAPVRVTIRQDETVLREGDVIVPSTLEALDALGLLQTQRDWHELAGQSLLAIVVAALIAFYIAEQPRQVWAQWRRIAVVLAGIAVTLFAAKLMVPGHALQPYLLPMPALAMMLSLIFGAPIAVVITTCLGLVIGQMSATGLEQGLIFYQFAGSVAAAISMRRVDRVNAFALSGIAIMLANTSSIGIFALLSPQPVLPVEILLRLGAGLLNAVLSVSFALAGYSLTAHYLDIVTPLQLLELSRPTHPLLRRLLLNAPGTYHHTLLLSNMAERAAEAIGADPLLARVAAYYHDIGKAVQPFFFIENQVDHDNPHDRLNDPYESARIVINHVYDGLALAQKYRLPKPITDVIAQHHGTMLTAYFLHQAKTHAANSEVDESFFRYPGPRPQSREAAIIMLADGSEAAVRATRPSTVEELAVVLQKIFRDRLTSGELDESALQLRDLELIRRAFVEILQGQFHPRIQYPSDAREALPEPPRGVWLEGATIPEREK